MTTQELEAYLESLDRTSVNVLLKIIEEERKREQQERDALETGG